MNNKNIKIMVDGTVVGVVENPQFAIEKEEPCTDEFSDPWRTHNDKRLYEITGNFSIEEPGDILRDIFTNGKTDVVIEQKVRKLPRKIKKALISSYKRMTKWKHKADAFIRKHQYCIPNAEMVITSTKQETLIATISGRTFKRKSLND
jgi:hypothetical protein